MANLRTYAPDQITLPSAANKDLKSSVRANGSAARRANGATVVQRDLSVNGKRPAPIATSIALLYTGEPSVGCPFDAAIMCGMSRGMQDHGYDLIVLDARRSRLPGESFAALFHRKGICGAVLRTTGTTRHIAAELAGAGLPAVVVADRIDLPGVSYVYSDSREESVEAVEHLISLGHRRIAICINVVDDSDHADRFNAYKQALANNNIEFDPRLVMRVPAHREAGEQAVRRLMNMPGRPTAVFLTDPMVAQGMLCELGRQGISVPSQLSVVGFDDSQLRFGVHPRLTAVCQDAPTLGREAFHVLHAMLTRETPAEPVRRALRTWLEIHDSTAAPVGE